MSFTPEQIAANVEATLSRKELKRQLFFQKRNTSKKFRRKRAIIWKETDYHCVYCNSTPHEKERTFDHIYPKCRGGSFAIENLMPACRECNIKRGNEFPPSPFAHPRWRRYVQKKEAAMGIITSNDAGSPE